MSGLTKDHIKYHFLDNPEWERVFLKHYPNWTPETYVKDAKKLFEANGYSFECERVTNNKKNSLYNVFTVNLYKGKVEDDDFIFGMRHLRGDGKGDEVEQVLIACICQYEVDISKFQ